MFKDAHMFDKTVRPITQLAWRNFFIYLAMMTFVFVGLLYLAVSLQNRHELSRFEISVDALANSTTNSLWHYDLAAIQSGVDAFGQVWRDKDIRVVDQYGSLVGSSHGARPSGSPSFTKPLLANNVRKIGEIQVWGDKSELGNDQFAPLFSMLGGAYLLLALLSYSLFTRFVRRHVVTPSHAILSQFENPNERSRNHSLPQNTPREFREISLNLENSFENFRVDREAQFEIEKQYKEVVSEFVKILKQHTTTFVLLDETGRLIDGGTSHPFSPDDLDDILLLALGKHSLTTAFEQMGFDIHQITETAENSEHFYAEVFFESDDYVRVDRIRLFNGHIFMTVVGRQDNVWSNNLLSDFLQQTESGLMIFDPRGRMHLETGRALTEILNIESEPIQFNDFLINFPAVGTLEAMQPKNLEYVDENSEIYQFSLLKEKRGWIGVSHQNITSHRKNEDQIRQAQRMVEMGQLSSGVAHNFNNSLAVVMGQLELASMGNNNEDTQIHISTAQESAKQATSVVSQLLAFTKNQEIDSRAIFIDDLIKDNEGIMETAATEVHTVKLSLNSKAEIETDPAQLSSAILNLVINARDAMVKPGTIMITTDVCCDDDSNSDLVRIKVADEGPGIPKDIQRKIYEPFYSTKGDSGGFGLGLASVKSIVEQSQGTIECESSERGTCFTILIPAKSDVVRLQSNKAKDFEVGRGDAEILVVDDDDLVRETQTQLISYINPKVHEFSDGYDAIEFASQNSNLTHAIVDLQMPKLSGFEVATQLRQINSNLRIVILSGNTTEINQSDFEDIGVTDFLSKPVNLDALRSILSTGVLH